jgi:GT2 family glycosyltransferase
MLDEVAWRWSRHGAAGQVLTEALFAFFEDVELDWRARRFGWTAWFTPSAVVAHERGGRGARRSTAVEVLNWANRLLVTRTCDDQRALRRAAVHYVATSVLLLARMVVRRPTAVLPALARWLRGRRTAAHRAQELDDRARLSAAEVLAQWEQPFSWRRWIRAWATRIR